MSSTVILFYPRTERENISRHYPYSVVSIATVLKTKGYETIIIDSRFDDSYYEKIKSVNSKIVMAGVSVMTGHQIIDGLQFSKFMKSINPSAKVVWGGWHPSLLPEQTLENEYIDVVVIGQGEPVIEGLVKASSGQKDFQDIPNIYYKNGKVQKTGSVNASTLSDYPQPRIDLLPVENYIHPGNFGNRTMYYYTSQGCPFRCGFCCDMTVNKRRWRSRSADEVISFLAVLKKEYHVDSINFLDTNFFIDKKRVEDIAKGMIRQKIGVKWEASVRTDQVVRYSENFLELLQESGCRKLFIGAESGSDEVLDFISKDTTVEQTYKTAEKLDTAGIIGEFFIMAGFPMATKDDLSASLYMIQKIKSRYINHQFTPFLYTPYPGTPLYQVSIKCGFKPPNTLEGWGNWSVLNVHTPWIDETYKDRFYSFVKFYYPMAFPSKKLIEIMEKSWFAPLLRLLIAICRYRCQNNLFNFPLDWKIVKWFYRLQKMFNRYFIPSIR